MAWPVISDVIGAVKAVTASSNESSAPTEAPADVAAETSSETVVADTTPNAEESPSEPTTPETSTTTLAEQIKTKGAKAFFEELPAEVKEEFWSESYRKLHQTLSAERKARENDARQNAAQVAAIEQRIDSRLEEILTAGMSDEEKATRAEKRELDRLRAETKKPEPQDPLQNPEVRARINEGWAVIEAAGLPKDPNDPRVKAVWAEAWEESDPEAGLTKMRTAASKHGKKTEPKSEPKPEVDIDKLVAERVAKALDERLKGSLLRTDNGRPGSSGAGQTKANTFDDARKAMEAALIAANGRS